MVEHCHCISSVSPASSVASFLVWEEGGGGARPPYVPTEQNNMYGLHVTYAWASEASERLRNIYYYFQVSKYICIHKTINAVPFYYLWYMAVVDPWGAQQARPLKFDRLWFVETHFVS